MTNVPDVKNHRESIFPESETKESRVRDKVERDSFGDLESQRQPQKTTLPTPHSKSLKREFLCN